MRWALLVSLCAGTVAVAADLAVMSAGALEAAVAPIIDEFQRASGQTVTVEYGTSPQLSARLAKNQTADVLIAPDTVMKQAIADRQVVASTRVPGGRIGVGVVVRRGAPAPDVSSGDALKKALAGVDPALLTVLPFNSGCFALVELPEALGLTSEQVRRHLLDHHDTGLISLEPRYLRIAHCSVDAAALPELVRRLEKGISELA